MSDEFTQSTREMGPIVPESQKPQVNPVEMIGQSIDKTQTGL